MKKLNAIEMAAIEGVMEAATSAGLKPVLSSDPDPTLSIIDPKEPTAPLARAPLPLSDEDRERLWRAVTERYFDPHDPTIRRVEVRQRRDDGRIVRALTEVDMKKLIRLSPMAFRIVRLITSTIDRGHLTGNEVWIQDRLTEEERHWHTWRHGQYGPGGWQGPGWMGGRYLPDEEKAREYLNNMLSVYGTGHTYQRIYWKWHVFDPKKETPEEFFASEVRRMQDLGNIVQVGSTDVTAAYFEPGQNN